MTAKLQREIVIEFEKVKLIRKRAKTTVSRCSGCGEPTDMVSLLEAAALFETDPENLLGFTNENNCHYDMSDKSNIYLCVVSLLESMNRQDKTRRLMAYGE